MRILPTYSPAITTALATTMITPAKLGSGRGQPSPQAGHGMQRYVTRQQEEGAANQPPRLLLRRFPGIAIPFRSQPPHQHAAGEQLNDAVQGKSQQRHAAGLYARPEAGPGLGQVPHQADPDQKQRSAPQSIMLLHQSYSLPLL